MERKAAKKLMLIQGWCERLDERVLRNGASHSLASEPRATCRTWARAIAETWPDLDGLWSPSTLTGRINVTPAADTFPRARTSPSTSMPRLCGPSCARSTAATRATA